MLNEDCEVGTAADDMAVRVLMAGRKRLTRYQAACLIQGILRFPNCR